MLRTRTILSCAALTALVIQTWAPVASMSMDKTFVTKAAMANQEEVAQAQLERNSSNTDARQFAMRMIRDHSMANTKLQAVAAKLGMSADFQQGKSMSKMPRQLSGSAYLKKEISVHRQAIAMFTQEASSGKASALRTYAKQSLPILMMHLQLAESGSKM